MGIFMDGSADITTILSWIPCKISAASQSIKHFTFLGSSAEASMKILAHKEQQLKHPDRISTVHKTSWQRYWPIAISNK